MNRLQDFISDFFKQEFLAEFEKQLRNEQLRSVGKTPLQDRHVAQPVAPPTRNGPHDDTCTAPADMLIAFKVSAADFLFIYRQPVLYDISFMEIKVEICRLGSAQVPSFLINSLGRK